MLTLCPVVSTIVCRVFLFLLSCILILILVSRFLLPTKFPLLSCLDNQYLDSKTMILVYNFRPYGYAIGSNEQGRLFLGLRQILGHLSAAERDAANHYPTHTLRALGGAHGAASARDSRQTAHSHHAYRRVSTPLQSLLLMSSSLRGVGSARGAQANGGTASARGQ